MLRSFRFNPLSDDDLPEVITAEMLTPPPPFDPDDESAFSASMGENLKLVYMLRKIDGPVSILDVCVRDLIGIELTAAGLANAGEGKWRVGDDVRGEYRRIGFATGITGRIPIDRMVEEFAAANRSQAFTIDKIKQLLAPYRGLIGKDDASVRDTLDRFLAQNADIWHDLRRLGCAVVKLMADNIAALTGDDLITKICRGMGMRHSTESGGQRSLRNALIMLSMIVNDLRRQHIGVIVEATWEWSDGFRAFIGDHLVETRQQFDDSQAALVDLEDFPGIEEAAWNAVERASRQNPDGE